MRAIQNFSKKPGEPFAIVWERYKDLLHAIPHHGLDVGQICAYFHQGLSLNNKQYIQMMCVGEFYEKSARDAIQFFDTIEENARTWETNTSLDTAKVHSTSTGGGIHHLRESDDLQAKIANLTRKSEAIELKKLNEVTIVPQVLWCLWDLEWRSHASFVMTPLTQILIALTFLKSKEQPRPEF